MQNQMMNMLMNQLKAKNPQMFQMINQARQNQGNPMEMFHQVTNNFSDEQKKNFNNLAKQFGFTDEQLNKVNGINSK